MGNAIHRVRSYVIDMLRATRALLGPLAMQIRAPEIEHTAQVRLVLENVLRTLNMHVDELNEHLARLGEDSPNETLDLDVHSPVNAATGKGLRDCYASLSLAHAAALMLESNARALGFSATAALARRHREDLGGMLMRLRELLPASVKGEVDGIVKRSAV